MYGIQGSTGVIQFVAPITVRSNRPVFSSDTLSLKRRASMRAAQRWEIQANLIPLAAGGNQLMVELVTKGSTGEVTIIMPQNYGVILARAISATPTATALAGATQVTLSGVTGLIPQGTFVKFANHSKVYMTTTDRSGNGVVGLYPELRADITAQAMTCRDDVLMQAFFDTDVINGMAYTDGILMDLGTVKLIEKL